MLSSVRFRSKELLLRKTLCINTRRFADEDFGTKMIALLFKQFCLGVELLDTSNRQQFGLFADSNAADRFI